MLLDDETRCSLHWKDSWHMCLQVHMHALPGFCRTRPCFYRSIRSRSSCMIKAPVALSAYSDPACKTSPPRGYPGHHGQRPEPYSHCCWACLGASPRAEFQRCSTPGGCSRAGPCTHAGPSTDAKPMVAMVVPATATGTCAHGTPGRHHRSWHATPSPQWQR